MIAPSQGTIGACERYAARTLPTPGRGPVKFLGRAQSRGRLILILHSTTTSTGTERLWSVEIVGPSEAGLWQPQAPVCRGHCQLATANYPKSLPKFIHDVLNTWSK